MTAKTTKTTRTLRVHSCMISTAKNLAANHRMGESIHAQVLELGNASADTRWQSASESDFRVWEGVYFILTGQRAPSKKGYVWA